MHISHPNLTGDQMFENMKIQADGGYLKNREKLFSRMSDFDKILHGGVDLAPRRL